MGNGHFHGMVPAHGDTAAERTTARTFGSRSACRMRHMEIIEKHRKTVCFQCAPLVHGCCHRSVLRSWDRLEVHVGCMVFTGLLIAKLIKWHVICARVR